MPGQYDEKSFEAEIENYLLTDGGYVKRLNENYDRNLALDVDLALSFIRKTQPEKWDHLIDVLDDRARNVLIDHLTLALDSDYKGCLDVLRHGFDCYGRTFRVAYFKPASGMNPEVVEKYRANRLSIIRQLHYSSKDPKKSVDLVLFVNGIPAVTAELKNPMTGQNCGDAERQYKTDRDPSEKLFDFKKRALVHFAVDPDEVRMTTRLDREETFFLPFNLGHDRGAGNPPNPEGHRSHYLWERIWRRDDLLKIFARYMHLEKKTYEIDGRKKVVEKLIFPRFHQLDCVTYLLRRVPEDGVGNNYLVQHSTGSGKSNSIAWLTHRLSSLHDEDDEKIFNSVVVVTDRVVLDQQLQDTIYQIEHKEGVVVRIKGSGKSTQLAAALENERQIIITTLQTFPFVTEKLGTLPKRNYAVVIDEAHSSQGGESAAHLKGVLGGVGLLERAREEAEKNESLTDHEEYILKVMAMRGRQPNISFFAFTATPKFKTLKVFGRPGPDGANEPHHLYSMRQAIEEGFIMDVLKNYTAYKVYYRLQKAIEDDPVLEKKKASKALARFMRLHPHNISQKIEVIVEHFRTFVKNKIGGKAKAMVVTGGRLEVVRYKQAFDKYIRENDYDDVAALVAFSGTVKDPDDPAAEYTEVGMNEISEKELPDKFDTDDYQLLLVANKYQTGFDQPLLHTMYVDKRLSGVAAVQTLSRLNRVHEGKEDTFVLDFVNDAEEIREAFSRFYVKTTVGKDADPKQFIELKARLDVMRVYHWSEVEAFSKVFYKPHSQWTARDHSRLNSFIDPAVDRFKALDDDEKEEFRKVTAAFRNLYSFLSQVIPYYDTGLEKLYSYLRFLSAKLPGRSGGPKYVFDNEVNLKYYRLEKVFEGKINLSEDEEGEVDGPGDVGTGRQYGKEIELSRLIDILNDKFSTSFKPGDQLFFDQIVEDALDNDELRKTALVNSMENFGFVFLKALENMFIDRMDKNEDITVKYIEDSDFRKVVGKSLMRDVYEKFNAEA